MYTTLLYTLALSTTHSRGNNDAQWKYAIPGYSDKLHNNISRYTISPGLKTRVTTLAKHTQRTSTNISSLIICRWLALQASYHGQQDQDHGKDVLKYQGVPTTRKPHFPVSQSTVTLAKTPNWRNHQLSLQQLNQISSVIIPTDIVRYLDVDACQSRQRASDYHTLGIDIIFI